MGFLLSGSWLPILSATGTFESHEILSLAPVLTLSDSSGHEDVEMHRRKCCAFIPADEYFRTQFRFRDIEPAAFRALIPNLRSGRQWFNALRIQGTLNSSEFVTNEEATDGPDAC